MPQRAPSAPGRCSTRHARTAPGCLSGRRRPANGPVGTARRPLAGSSGSAMTVGAVWLTDEPPAAGADRAGPRPSEATTPRTIASDASGRRASTKAIARRATSAAGRCCRSTCGISPTHQTAKTRFRHPPIDAAIASTADRSLSAAGARRRRREDVLQSQAWQLSHRERAAGVYGVRQGQEPARWLGA